MNFNGTELQKFRRAAAALSLLSITAADYNADLGGKFVTMFRMKNSRCMKKTLLTSLSCNDFCSILLVCESHLRPLNQTLLLNFTPVNLKPPVTTEEVTKLFNLPTNLTFYNILKRNDALCNSPSL